MTTVWISALAVGAAVVLGGGAVTQAVAERTAGVETAGMINRDPGQIAGPDACAECHENEHRVWMESAHEADAKVLSRDPEAKRIAKVLGVRRIKTDAKCAGCHFTSKENESGKLRSIAGVSCESCHSASASWIDPHAQFGADAESAEDESAQHRADRLSYCDSMGMVRPDRLYELASACYSCHAITDQELIHTAGHPAGTEFEFASWSQGDLRHNFTRAGADANPVSAISRQRVMFLVGAAVRLESACRAVAIGAPAETISGAIDHLRRVDQAVTIDAVSSLIEIGEGVASGGDAAGAVERIRAIGVRIAAERVGEGLDQIDALIPGAYSSEGR